MQYSNMFHTEYDQPQAVGSIGYGNHYSIIDLIQWRDPWNFPLDSEKITVHRQRIGVVWDVDHDTRIMKVIERAYTHQLLAPVRFIGERRGQVFIVVTNDWAIESEYRAAWYRCVDAAIHDDEWGVDIVNQADIGAHGLITADEDVVTTYLKHIEYLWSIGHHTF